MTISAPARRLNTRLMKTRILPSTVMTGSSWRHGTPAGRPRPAPPGAYRDPNVGAYSPRNGCLEGGDYAGMTGTCQGRIVVVIHPFRALLSPTRQRRTRPQAP